MKRLLTCANLVEAHHKANLLIAAGICAEVRNTYLAGAVGDIPFVEAGPQVWVNAGHDAEAALNVLAAAERAAPDPDWVCGECGEAIEGQFAQCWRCGAMRPFA